MRPLPLLVAVLLSMGCDEEPSAPPPPAAPSIGVEPAAPTPAPQPTPSIGVDPAAPPAAEAGPGPVTDENWKDHPQVGDIQALVEGIDLSAKTSSWSTESVKDSGYDPSVYELAAALDESGQVRRLTFTEIGGDLSRTTAQYYDDAKQLRFVLADDAHSSSEALHRTRVYFDAAGKEIYRRDMEQISEQVGPTVSSPVDDRLIASSDEAKAVLATYRGFVNPGE